MNQEIKLRGDLTSRGAPTQTPSGRSGDAALGGAARLRRIFGNSSSRCATRSRACPRRRCGRARRRRATTAGAGHRVPAAAKAPSSEYVLPMDSFAPPADLGLASVARLRGRRKCRSRDDPRRRRCTTPSRRRGPTLRKARARDERRQRTASSRRGRTRRSGRRRAWTGSSRRPTTTRRRRRRRPSRRINPEHAVRRPRRRRPRPRPPRH